MKIPLINQICDNYFLKKNINRINFSNLLYVILLLEICNAIYFLYYFSINGYFPYPFLVDKNDTWMDFYSPLFWVIKDGFYTSFNSVYPALNYFFLKTFALAVPPDQVFNPFQLRNDFPMLGVIASFLYLLIIWLVINIGDWKKIEFSYKVPIFLVCILSVPVLFGLERGNLIFLALLFLALYLSEKNLWMRAIFFGALVNIKPYFVIFLLQYFNIHHFDKKELNRSVLVILIIFFSLGFIADLNFINFFKTYFLFSKKNAIPVEGIIALPHSIAALSTIKSLVIFKDGSSYTFWFSLLKVVNYLSVLILLWVTLIKKLTPLELLISCFVILTNFSISTGGYILIIYIILIPYLVHSKEYKSLIIYIVLIYAIPIDWINIFDINYSQVVSYLGGNLLIINPELFISIGSVIRPLCNYLLLISFLMHLLGKYPRASRPA